jgi:cytoskeletal protein RodZ
MVTSVGKKLQQSRVNKQLSIEEAARVTRIRPDKLLDLEDDNYSNFPSMSYAKGFLMIYARFLGVDVRDFAESLHAPNPVSSDDYEYLNAAAVGPQPAPSRRPYHFAPRSKRTILPVIVFAVLIGAVGLAIYVVVSFERLGNLEDIADKKDLASPGASPGISTISTVPAATPPVALSTRAPAPTLSEQAPAGTAASNIPVAPAAAPNTAAVQPPLPPPAPAGTFDPNREVRKAEPIQPTPPAHAEASPVAALPPVGDGPLPNQAVTSIIPIVPSSDAVKQVSITPLRKTMVTIRKDVADSAPIFEDWLYPGDGPLKVSGHKLWIQVQDPGAVQITRDGQPLPAGQSDIQIE